MTDFSSWLNMGGYYAYVWSAYGLVVSLFVANGLLVRKQRLSRLRSLRQWVKD